MEGENVKKYRQMKQMTQAQLANEVGVNQSMIAQIERGTKAMSLPLAKLICKALSIDIAML